MEIFQLLLGMIGGGLIVPLVQWLKGRFPNLPPFMAFSITNGLAIGCGFLLNNLLSVGLETNAVIMASLAIIGTTAQGIHAMSKKTKLMVNLKNGVKE